MIVPSDLESYALSPATSHLHPIWAGAESSAIGAIYELAALIATFADVFYGILPTLRRA